MKRLLQYGLWVVGFRTRYLVSGDSMSPEITSGTYVFGKKPKSLQRGDIAIAKHPFRSIYIIKKIESIGTNGVTLRSIDNFGEDSRSFGSIQRKNIIATVA